MPAAAPFVPPPLRALPRALPAVPLPPRVLGPFGSWRAGSRLASRPPSCLVFVYTVCLPLYRMHRSCQNRTAGPGPGQSPGGFLRAGLGPQGERGPNSYSHIGPAQVCPRPAARPTASPRSHKHIDIYRCCCFPPPRNVAILQSRPTLVAPLREFPRCVQNSLSMTQQPPAVGCNHHTTWHPTACVQVGRWR